MSGGKFLNTQDLGHFVRLCGLVARDLHYGRELSQGRSLSETSDWQLAGLDAQHALKTGMGITNIKPREFLQKHNSLELLDRFEAFVVFQCLRAMLLKDEPLDLKVLFDTLNLYQINKELRNKDVYSLHEIVPERKIDLGV